MELLKLKTEFLEHLEIEKNRSLLTIRNYDLYLKRFLAFAEKRGAGGPAGITLDLVRNYRLWLNRATPAMKLATQNYHVIALRSFLKYLGKNRAGQNPSPAGGFPRRRRPPKAPRRPGSGKNRASPPPGQSHPGTAVFHGTAWARTFHPLAPSDKPQ